MNRVAAVHLLLAPIAAQVPRRGVPALTALTCLALLALTPPASAQLGPWTGGQGTTGGHGGHHGRGGGQQRGSKAPAPAPLPPVHDPWPRLDAGALLCRTEADLTQHQAAIAARIRGDNAPEAAGCRLVRAMTPVTVVERHGPARTEVRLPGQPADQPGQVGWTDVAISEERPPAR